MQSCSEFQSCGLKVLQFGSKLAEQPNKITERLGNTIKLKFFFNFSFVIGFDYIYSYIRDHMK